MNSCTQCRYSIIQNKKMLCTFSPKWVTVDKNHYCAMHKEDINKVIGIEIDKSSQFANDVIQGKYMSNALRKFIESMRVCVKDRFELCQQRFAELLNLIERFEVALEDSKILSLSKMFDIENASNIFNASKVELIYLDYLIYAANQFDILPKFVVCADDNQFNEPMSLFYFYEIIFTTGIFGKRYDSLFKVLKRNKIKSISRLYFIYKNNGKIKGIGKALLPYLNQILQFYETHDKWD